MKEVKNTLEIYGSIFSSSDTKEVKEIQKNNTYREFIPNQNRMIIYVYYGVNNKRYFLDFFNEMIIINNKLVSIKMYLRSI